MEVLYVPILEVAGPLFKTRYKSTSQASTEPPVLHKCMLFFCCIYCLAVTACLVPKLEVSRVESLYNGSGFELIFILQLIRFCLDLG